MPRKYDAPSLQNLCGKSVEDALVNMSENFLTNKHASLDDFSGRIESCKQQFSKLPSSFHSMLAKHCLKAADRLAKEFCLKVSEKSLKSQIVVQHLVSIVTHLKLKEVYFCSWSVPVQASLLNYLWKMTHLEVLSYTPQRKTYGPPTENEIENLKRLHESLPFLSNLTKFSAKLCTDEIIVTLCEYCEDIEEINVRSADDVTDKCIDCLVRCTKLRKVSLTHEISDEAFIKLLLNSQSKNLIEIGDVANFDELLRTLEETISARSHSFQIQQVGSTELFDGFNLHLVPKHFPCITSLNVYQYIEELSDFSCLDNLKHLKEVSLKVYADHFNSLDPVYALKSQVLTKLTLVSHLQISLFGLINVGLQCPNLESLELEEDCSLVEDVDFLTVRTLGKPFQKLKEFSLDSKSTGSGAELIIALATNIEYFWIEENDSLTDAFLTSILKFNDLKELKILGISPGNNISLNMLKSIILNCKNIIRLCGFSTFSDDASSHEKVENLKKFISENNYNIDL